MELAAALSLHNMRDLLQVHTCEGMQEWWASQLVQDRLHGVVIAQLGLEIVKHS